MCTGRIVWCSWTTPFLLAAVAHARSVDCSLCVSLSVLSSRSRERFAMSKRWTRAPVLDGWIQIVRGSQPKAAQWPMQDRQNEAQPVSRFDQGCLSDVEDRSGGCATTPTIQPSSGCGGRRSQRGSPTIGSSHISFLRKQPTCHFEEGIETCRELEASQSHRGRRAEEGVRDCSAGGRSETQRGRGGGRVSSRASHSSDLGFAATNRHSGPRARFVESGEATNEEARSVDGRWTAGSRGFHPCPPQMSKRWRMVMFSKLRVAQRSRVPGSCDHCQSGCVGGTRFSFFWQDSLQMCPWVAKTSHPSCQL